MKVETAAARPRVVADQQEEEPTQEAQAPVSEPVGWNRKFAAHGPQRPNDAAYWKKLAQLQGDGPALATHVENLRDGATAWQRRLETIDGAQSSIMLTTFIIEADAYGFALLDRLIARAKAGVKVFMALDFVGTRAQSLTASEAARARMDELFAKLKQAGGEVAWYAPPVDQLAKLAQGTHYKSLIVDGTKAIVGGRNMAEKYFHEWTDFELRLEGPIVSKLAHESLQIIERSRTAATNDFTERLRYGRALADLREQLGAAPQRTTAGGVSFQIVAFDPNNDRGENRLTKALVETFKRAKKEIVLSSNFVNGDASIRNALIEAAKRGVSITVVTAGPQQSTLANLPYINAEIACRELHAAGIRVRETTTFEHGKMYAVDGRIGAFGSYNVEHPADVRLAEALLFTSDRATVQALRSQILDTANNRAREYTPSEPKKDLGSWFQRLLAKLVEPFV